jgi:hypothetical protein
VELAKSEQQKGVDEAEWAYIKVSKKEKKRTTHHSRKIWQNAVEEDRAKSADASDDADVQRCKLVFFVCEKKLKKKFAT